MKDNILSALDWLDVAALTHDEWLKAGMALKEEGYSLDVWDEWSRKDKRYKDGECARRWNSFQGRGNPVTGATIVQMAKDRGWTPYGGGDGSMEWDDPIEYDGDGCETERTEAAKPENAELAEPDNWNGADDLARYIEILFEPDDFVGYVTTDVWFSEDGRWAPSRGVYNRRAGDILAGLRKHPDDLGATVGDWKEEAGAWIRFNPLDGKGVKNDNVVKYKYALVESDTLPITEQLALYRKLELPIAALVHSGGKSLHAIVKVEAANYDEYRDRVSFLYDHLAKNGVEIDKQNRNPSRLSRMPGVTRNGKPQRLIDVNTGRPTWESWLDFVDGIADGLPDAVPLAMYRFIPPMLKPVLIAGILRCGHKMLISGPSKAGKSFLLIELVICLAAGIPWLGFDCRKSRVLYVNLEIDEESLRDRINKVYEAFGISTESMDNITLWNLRGCAIPLDQLAPAIIRRAKRFNCEVIVIDPIYKVITGDENNASEMGAFCNQFDKICRETGAAVIYCHHHSKGAQGAKRAMDRASGSGVFARDPDAQLDMIQLELTDDLKNNVRDGNATAWRMEASLREFPNFKPVNFWFRHPIHVLDESGELDAAYAEGSPQNNLGKSGKRNTQIERFGSVDGAFNYQNDVGIGVLIKDMAKYAGVSVQCMRRRIEEYDSKYKIVGNVCMLKEQNS